MTNDTPLDIAKHEYSRFGGMHFVLNTLRVAEENGHDLDAVFESLERLAEDGRKSSLAMLTELSR